MSQNLRDHDKAFFLFQDGEYRRALASWLQSQEWDYFFTITCRRERRDRLALLRDVKGELDEKSYHGRGFIAIEPHFNGGIHAHGLVYNHPQAVVGDYAHNAGDFWYSSFQKFGRSRFSTVKSVESVSAYCAKYVTKKICEWDYFDFTNLGRKIK